LASYNWHGFNHGYPELGAEILLLKAHCPTPASLDILDKKVTGYFTLRCSAMLTAVETYIIKGTQYVGIMLTMKKNLHTITITIC
jgi:hypothetical protein